MTGIKEWAIAIAITFMLVMAIYGAWIMSIILVVLGTAYCIKLSQEVDRE